MTVEMIAAAAQSEPVGGSPERRALLRAVAANRAQQAQNGISRAFRPSLGDHGTPQLREKLRIIQ